MDAYEKGKPSAWTEADSVPENRGTLWILLNKVQDLELRMIRGVFRFVFRKVPSFLWDTLCRWAPTLAKFLQVVALGAVLAIIVGGPLLYASYPSYHLLVADIDGFLMALGQLAFAVPFDEVPRALVILWTALAAIGAVWGIFYVRRRAARKHKAWFWRRRSEPAGATADGAGGGPQAGPWR